MKKKVVVICSIGCVAVGLVLGMYIFTKLSHNNTYEKGLFVNREVNTKYAGYIC